MNRATRERRTPRRTSPVIVVVGLLAGTLATSAGPASAGGLLDGRIVYSDIVGGTGLYAIDPDGRRRTHLIDRRNTYGPKWLQDGSGVSFVVEAKKSSGNPNRLDVVDADGSNRRVLLPGSALPAGRSIASYDWSPDGTQLALCLTRGEHFDQPRIYVSSPDGSAMDLVLKRACQPDWSSTDRIVVRRGFRQILHFDPDGGNLATIRPGGHVNQPVWSPDAQRVVLMCGRPNSVDICVMDADGTNFIQLTDSATRDWSPTWSPSGRRIVWGPEDSLTGLNDLWRMRPDGSAQRQITHTRWIDEYEPDWIAPV